MRKGLLFLLVVLALAAGGFHVLRGGASTGDVQTVAHANPDASLKIRCGRCGYVFAPDEGEPVAENHRLVRCPSCGRTTPRVLGKAGR